MSSKPFRKRLASNTISTPRRQMNKKTYKKKATKLNTRVVAGIGLPKQLLSTLKYNDTFYLSSSSGTITTWQYILNGLYDPDYTGTGHQPMYFDQLMGIYNHYCVIGTKMKVTFTAYDENIVPMTVGLWQNDDTAIVPTNFNSMTEQSKGKQAVIGNGGDGQVTLELKWSAKQTFGNGVLANNALRGSASANPTENCVGVLVIQSADKITTTALVVQVELEFITMFTELKDISGS